MPDVTVFGSYELRRLIGRGGMGEVYEAFDTDQQRVVALKLLPASLASDPGFVERFRRESHVTAQLTDPHVIPIHRYGEIDGRLYIDMRMVHGSDLSELLHQVGALPPHRAVFLISQAAQALDSAHASNLIHRDVKPSNLLITAQDFVYLVDFGIAHTYGPDTGQGPLTATGATIGTLDYMAPERFANPGAIDARTDVYSLACVFFECLTGRRPYPVTGLPALMHAHLDLQPPRVTDVVAALPVGLDAVIARGMAKNPAHRYSSPGELARDASRAISADPPGFWAQSPTTLDPAPTAVNAIPAPPTALNRPLAPPTEVNQPPAPATAIVRPGPPAGPEIQPSDPGSKIGRAGWVVIAAVIVVAAVIGGFLISRSDNTDSSAGITGSSTTGSPSAGDSASSGQASAQSPGGTGQQSVSTVPATAVAAPVSADLLPTASGAFGEKPTLTFPATDPVASLQRVVLTEGAGPVTASGDWLITNYLGQVWGGEVFDNSYDKGTTSAFQIGVGAVVPGWDTALVGVPVGSRVMLVLPPADGYGSSGNPQAGITGTDTLVFVVDIVQAVGVTSGGQIDAVPQEPPANAPQVAGALGGPATVTVPAGVPEPTAAVVSVLALGTGAPIQLGQVLVQYTAVTWTGEPAGTTWPAADPAAGDGGQGPQELPVAADGPFAGLVGVPLGSRVLVQVPGQADPSTGQTQPSIAAVVDVLLQTTVSAAG